MRIGNANICNKRCLKLKFLMNRVTAQRYSNQIHWFSTCCKSAIELYARVYPLFLPGSDFWRAANSFQLDKTVWIYVSRLLGSNQYHGLLNNEHQLVPLPTTGAGYRLLLLLHGFASESPHSILREHKHNQNGMWFCLFSIQKWINFFRFYLLLVW